MIEMILIHILKLLFFALCAETIITFALIIALAKIKANKNTISLLADGDMVYKN